MKKSYTKGINHPDLLNVTIGEQFDYIAHKYPEQQALVSRHQRENGSPIRLSYSELHRKVEICAKGMLALGVAKGDRVGIWSANCLEWCIIQLASAKVGAILIGINPAYKQQELQYILQQSQCNWLISAEAYMGYNYTQIIYQLFPELPSKSKDLPYFKGAISLGEKANLGITSWNELAILAKGINDSELKQRQLVLSPYDPINIQYTSGTTGFSKGATLSHHNILNNAYFITGNMHFSPKDRLVIPVPLFHCFGMVLSVLGSMVHGATMILSSDLFSPIQVLKAVEEESATALYGVPSMFISILSHPRFSDFNLSSLRTGIMSGAPCPEELMNSVMTKMHMKEVQIAYGMTETSPVSVQTSSNDPINMRVKSVGKTLPHIENKIIDNSGNIVERGQIGEICTKGYNVMLGYWNDPTATNAAIDSEGWMHSGDLGKMDDNGYIYIVGRINDMIIRGGENIYPREIEDFLHTHPSIQNVQITGIPSERFGQEVQAWIILKPEMTVTKNEIIAFCSGKIADYKIPRFINFVDNFPMTTTGKVQKFKLNNEEYATLNSDDKCNAHS